MVAMIADTCPRCEKRLGVVFGLRGFGWRQQGHENRCLRRSIRQGAQQELPDIRVVPVVTKDEAVTCVATIEAPVTSEAQIEEAPLPADSCSPTVAASLSTQVPVGSCDSVAATGNTQLPVGTAEIGMPKVEDIPETRDAGAFEHQDDEHHFVHEEQSAPLPAVEKPGQGEAAIVREKEALPVEAADKPAQAEVAIVDENEMPPPSADKHAPYAAVVEEMQAPPPAAEKPVQKPVAFGHELEAPPPIAEKSVQEVVAVEEAKEASPPAATNAQEEAVVAKAGKEISPSVEDDGSVASIGTDDTGTKVAQTFNMAETEVAEKEEEKKFDKDDAEADAEQEYSQVPQGEAFGQSQQMEEEVAAATKKNTKRRRNANKKKAPQWRRCDEPSSKAEC